MIKTLCQAIMKWSELASKYHQTKYTKDYKNYKNQINFWRNREGNSKQFRYISIKDITDNKKFWKTLEPLLSDKATCGSSKINLVVDEENVSDGK